MLSDALAAEIVHNYGRGRRLVAVDGAAGTKLFADALGVAFREAGHAIVRASLDDFLQPRAVREQQGAASAAGYYSDRYDYPTFLRVLVQPFKLGGSAGFVGASFDASRDRALEPRWLTAPADAILLVDGPFLQRPELRGIFNFVVYLEPDTSKLDPRIDGADELYIGAVQPRSASDAIVSAFDEDEPRRVFADRC
ncbi:hypothetical protein B7R54_10270 [Subtercola boreus]|uniref:Uridine kinase n=1 Tax=Subtercola boreus TaxID=120213 RepID=A0A3E0VIT2_9MICO|nr:hypothetical protein B7R54_10270 [Subtercola boreus]